MTGEEPTKEATVTGTMARMTPSEPDHRKRRKRSKRSKRWKLCAPKSGAEGRRDAVYAVDRAWYLRAHGPGGSGRPRDGGLL